MCVKQIYACASNNNHHRLMQVCLFFQFSERSNKINLLLMMHRHKFPYWKAHQSKLLDYKHLEIDSLKQSRLTYIHLVCHDFFSKNFNLKIWSSKKTPLIQIKGDNDPS